MLVGRNQNCQLFLIAGNALFNYLIISPHIKIKY